jgi:hypothetical protein
MADKVKKGAKGRVSSRYRPTRYRRRAKSQNPAKHQQERKSSMQLVKESVIRAAIGESRTSP